MQKLKLGLSNDGLADITLPSGESIRQFKHVVQKAKQEGIDVFECENASNDYTPTLLIGGTPYTNEYTTHKYMAAPFATLVGFRTINEAVALANNSRQALGATVWTENIALANEISRKLEVCLILTD